MSRNGRKGETEAKRHVEGQLPSNKPNGRTGVLKHCSGPVSRVLEPYAVPSRPVRPISRAS